MTTSTFFLRLSIITVAIFLSLNLYAGSTTWLLLKETTSSIVSSHNKGQSIAAFNTEEKCKAALERNITNDVAKLKAQRADNSVVTNFVKITYACKSDADTKNSTFSKQKQTITKHDELVEHKKQME